MSEMVRAGIVRILRESDQKVVGVGFIIDAAKRTILTCAHVVNAAIDNFNNKDKPRSLISVDFPFLANSQRYDTRVLHFHPKGTDGAGDLAVLEVLEPLPDKAKAVRLAVSETYNGHEYGVYGFPAKFEGSGQYVEGRLQERLANKRIQAVGTTNLGYFVDQGFSGSPVIDKQLDAVIGMMMQVDNEPDKRVSFLSPVDVLTELFTDLKFEQLTAPNITPTKSHIGMQPSGKWLQRVDIFISSPSDVSEEREAILRVIERLNRLSYIRSRYVLNPLLYEREVPPEAGDHAQMIVDRYMVVEDSYLLICLMWNRMGTPFTDPKTGEEFQSGTEYEFTIGYRANGKSGQPHLLLYRKTTEQADTDKSEKEKVDTFFKQFEGKVSTFKGLYKPFSSLGEFENMLFEHIDRILHDNPPDADRPDTRINPDTRPDIVEEARRLDAAMPRECQVGKPTEVRVMFSLPDSVGLKLFLPDYTEHGDLISKTDVLASNMAVAFKRDKTGNLLPELLFVEIRASDFNIEDAKHTVKLSSGSDSSMIVFNLTASKARTRSLVQVFVRSNYENGHLITLGSVSLYTDIVPIGVQLVTQKAWTLLSSMFSKSFPQTVSVGDFESKPSEPRPRFSGSPSELKDRFVGSQHKSNSRKMMSILRDPSAQFIIVVLALLIAIVIIFIASR